MNGVLLMDRNFGECQSFNESSSLITGFISALSSFSGEITDSILKSINFEDFIMYIFKDPQEKKLLYIFITDVEDDPKQIQYKFKKIADIFRRKYKKYLNNFKGNINSFESFGNILIEMNIAQKNCGGHFECEECPKKEESSKVYQILKRSEKDFIENN